MKHVSKLSWVVWIPILILVVLRIPSLFESYWYGDEAIYAAVAKALTQGKSLYAGAWDHKPPFIFWFFYPAALMGWGVGFVFLRFLNILLAALTLFFISEFLKKQVSNISRFIALLFLSLTLGSTILEGNVVNAEVIFIVFNTLALLLFYKRKSFVFVGALGFLSLITKVPGFVEFAVIAVCFALIYLKEKGIAFAVSSSLKALAGFSLPVVFMLAIFWLNNTLPDFVYANATFNRIYSLTQANSINGIATTYLSAFSLVSVFLLASIFYLKGRWNSLSYIAICLFAVEGFASLLSGKNYSHYFLQVLPSITLLIAIFVDFSMSKKHKLDKFLFLIILLLVPMFVVFRNGGSLPMYARPHEYYPWFVSNRERFWWGNGYGVKKTKNFSNHFDNNYLEYSPAYIYTDKPWIEALVNRELTNKYVVWFHLQYRQEHLDEELNNMTRSNLFVLDNDPPLLDDVSRLLESDFEKIDSYENFDIYIKK